MSNTNNQERAAGITGSRRSEDPPPAMLISPEEIQHDYFNDRLFSDTSLCTQCWAACCLASFSPSSIKRGTCIEASHYSAKIFYT
jgi:hypothetical protein